MELTIDQALQQGVSAHKAGKLQDAERLYQAILQSQPKHPDANHNLGLIAVAVNKADTALPLFKTALETNPKVEQFWLSYIDALIKEKQSEVAKQVIERAKKQGVSREKVDALEKQLTLITQGTGSALPEEKKSQTFSQRRKKLAENKRNKKKKKGLKDPSPSDAEINTLLQHYQNGRFGDAEQLAVSLTERFPTHPFFWKVVGAVLKQTGRPNESLTATQKSVQLSPQDSEAYFNLGITLLELDRLDEAEASFRQAVALRPDHVEAQNNL
ncbi:MAG: tetratricopeptide repeat protein, partial [Pseudomonadales bacterium]